MCVSKKYTYPPHEGTLEISGVGWGGGGGGGYGKQKVGGEGEQLNWNFQKGWGKEQTNINSQWPGEYGNFLDLHIILKVNRLHCTYFWHPQLSTTYQIPFACKKY